MAGPLRPNPPPSSFMAVGKVERWKKRHFSLMARPLREDAFFAASNYIYGNGLYMRLKQGRTQGYIYFIFFRGIFIAYMNRKGKRGKRSILIYHNFL